MTKSAFLGGALSFKGAKKKSKKKKKSKSKHKLKDERDVAQVTRSSPPSDEDDVDDEMTEAERKALKFKRRRQQEESKKIAQLSHRERVETLNEKLGNMTELNDIPRVSAAGNG